MTFFGELLALGFLPTAPLAREPASELAGESEAVPSCHYSRGSAELSAGTGNLSTNHAHMSDSLLAAAGEGVDEGLPRVGVPSELEVVKAAR